MKNMEQAPGDASAKNWRLGSGWFVGEVGDIYPGTGTESRVPGTKERLESLAPGIVIPENRTQLLNMLKEGIAKSRAESKSIEA